MCSFDFLSISLCLRYALYIYAIPRLMQCLFFLVYFPVTAREHKLLRKRYEIGATVQKNTTFRRHSLAIVREELMKGNKALCVRRFAFCNGRTATGVCFLSTERSQILSSSPISRAGCSMSR